MKTFQQFCEQAYNLNEFKIGNPLQNPTIRRVASPVFRNLERIENIATVIGATPGKKDIASRAAAAYGIAKPLSFPSMAPDIVKQGQTGSFVDKTARAIPGMTPNPKTDIGRRLGTAISGVASKAFTPPTASGRVKVGTDKTGKPIYMDK